MSIQRVGSTIPPLPACEQVEAVSSVDEKISRIAQEHIPQAAAAKSKKKKKKKPPTVESSPSKISYASHEFAVVIRAPVFPSYPGAQKPNYDLFNQIMYADPLRGFSRGIDSLFFNLFSKERRFLYEYPHYYIYLLHIYAMLNDFFHDYDLLVREKRILYGGNDKLYPNAIAELNRRFNRRFSPQDYPTVTTINYLFSIALDQAHCLIIPFEQKQIDVDLATMFKELSNRFSLRTSLLTTIYPRCLTEVHNKGHAIFESYQETLKLVETTYKTLIQSAASVSDPITLAYFYKEALTAFKQWLEQCDTPFLQYTHAHLAEYSHSDNLNLTDEEIKADVQSLFKIFLHSTNPQLNQALFIYSLSCASDHTLYRSTLLTALNVTCYFLGLELSKDELLAIFNDSIDLFEFLKDPDYEAQFHAIQEPLNLHKNSVLEHAEALNVDAKTIDSIEHLYFALPQFIQADKLEILQQNLDPAIAVRDRIAQGKNDPKKVGEELYHILFYSHSTLSLQNTLMEQIPKLLEKLEGFYDQFKEEETIALFLRNLREGYTLILNHTHFTHQALLTIAQRLDRLFDPQAIANKCESRRLAAEQALLQMDEEKTSAPKQKKKAAQAPKSEAAAEPKIQASKSPSPLTLEAFGTEIEDPQAPSTVQQLRALCSNSPSGKNLFLFLSYLEEPSNTIAEKTDLMRQILENSLHLIFEHFGQEIPSTHNPRALVRILFKQELPQEITQILWKHKTIFSLLAQANESVNYHYSFQPYAEQSKKLHKYLESPDTNLSEKLKEQTLNAAFELLDALKNPGKYRGAVKPINIDFFIEEEALHSQDEKEIQSQELQAEAAAAKPDEISSINSVEKAIQGIKQALKWIILRQKADVKGAQKDERNLAFKNLEIYLKRLQTVLTSEPTLCHSTLGPMKLVRRMIKEALIALLYHEGADEIAAQYRNENNPLKLHELLKAHTRCQLDKPPPFLSLLHLSTIYPYPLENHRHLSRHPLVIALLDALIQLFEDQCLIEEHGRDFVVQTQRGQISAERIQEQMLRLIDQTQTNIIFPTLNYLLKILSQGFQVENH